MSRFLRILSVFSFLMSAIPLIAGCDIGQKPPTTVPIGAVYPLSGTLAPGADIRQGIELAVEIINGEYDLDLPLARPAGLPNLGGARIEIVWADHGGDPEKGAAETRRLLEEEKVVALLGAYQSSVTAQASQVAEAAGVPFLNPESSSPSLTQRGFRWFFRTTADDSIFVRNFFDFLADLKARRGFAPQSLAIVYENSLFGTGVGQLESEQAQQAGLTVAAEVPYAATTTDVRAEVQKIVASGATVVMQASYDQDAILFMQTYKAFGYRPEAILAMDAGFISPAFVNTLGDDANYVLSRDVWALDLGRARPLITRVNDLYHQRYGTNMTGTSTRAFTGLIVLADAINRAGSTEPERIRQALLATNLPAEQLIMPWDGVRFDPQTGQNVLARGIIVQIQERAYYTVWPWDLASRDLIWPMPDWGQ